MADAIESLRNNPQVRAEVQRVLDERSEAFEQAQELLDKAVRIMGSVSYLGVDDGIYDRSFKAVRRAKMQLAGDEHYVVGFGSETYVGNKAAFELGLAIADKLGINYKKGRG